MLTAMAKSEHKNPASNKMSNKCAWNLPSNHSKSRTINRSTISRAPPDPAPPRGHCWDYCGNGCKWGDKCRWKHDEAVRKTFAEKISTTNNTTSAKNNPTKKAAVEKAPSKVPMKQKRTYTQAISGSTPQKCLSRTTTAFPKTSKPDYTQTIGQYPTPPSTPGSEILVLNNWSKSTELTPLTTTNWAVSQSSWDTPTPYFTRAAGTDIWETDCHLSQTNEISIQVFKKIYSTSIKLPRLTTGSRMPGNNTSQLSEIAEAALKYFQKQDLKSNSGTLKPTSIKDKRIVVQAAECYKNLLLAAKISNVLNKKQQAHLDVIIASQHWEDINSPTDNEHSTVDVHVLQSVAKPLEHMSDQQLSSPKIWSPSKYLEWAKRNLTDATAIKLARTYCDHLENGTAPIALFSRMGKQAPHGTSFEYFSLLPYELREQIWLLVLEEEKNDVRIIWQHKSKDEHFTNNCFINANNQQRLLFVNHELQGLAMKHNYELAFGTPYSPAKTYFDFKRDRLFIHTCGCNELPQLVKYISTKDAERVQTLAIPLRDFLRGDEHKIAEALCKFKSVKKVHLVCGDGLEDVTICRAGDPQLAKNIERFLYKTWHRHNDPHSYPRVRMQTMPAMLAQYLKIDNLLPSPW